MNKNSLVNIVYQRSIQRSLSQKGKLDLLNHHQQLNSINKSQSSMAFNQQKMIKITQFNSGLVLKERLSAPLPLAVASFASSCSPCKHFSIKKNKDIRKGQMTTDSIIEAELQRRQKPNQGSRQLLGSFCSPEHKNKILTASKWKFRHQILDLDLLANEINSSQSVVVVRPLPPDSNDSKNRKNALTNNHYKQSSKTASCRQRFAPKPTIQITTSGRAPNDRTLQDGILTRMTFSPKKRYNMHLQQQKKYQENIEREKREFLENRKELNKNYAKPFNPPENISAYAYIVYEADSKKIPRNRKLSGKKQEQQGLTEIRKLFLHSHKVIVSSNSRTVLEMASLTKIMTCLVTIETAHKLGIQLDKQQVTVGYFQQNIGGTSASIKKGQIYTVLQLLYGLMLPSGNDASLALAVWAGQKLLCNQAKKDQQPTAKLRKKQCYDRFISQMNSKAWKLNMQKTKYANSHGLVNSQNKSCCFDLCILCQYAMSNHLFRQIVSCKQYEGEIKMEVQGDNKTGTKDQKRIVKRKSMNVNNQSFQVPKDMQQQQLKDMLDYEDNIFDEQQQQQPLKNIQIITKTVKWENTHQLVQQKSELYLGIKTGITNTAGPCLASCIEKYQRRFIIVVLNCKSMKQRFKDTQNLRKWLFQKEGLKHDEKFNLEEVATC